MLPVMNSLEQKILAAFDEPGARARSLADLGDPATVQGVVSQLVERGWLRATEAPDTYARTEDGRLQLAGPRDVTIYQVNTRAFSATHNLQGVASRLDQIHFKLFAMVDQGGGRHEADLRALSPTPGELAAAAHWSITQDPSPGYRSVLADALRVLGVNDADLGD